MGKLSRAVANGLAAIQIALSAVPAAAAAPLIAAHRGNAGTGAPENTLAAYNDAVAAGVDAIEIDLRATADGAVVVMHDATVDRTTDGHGRVERMTLGAVEALDAGGGERVPTLGAVLDLVRGGRVSVLLDMKRGGAVTPAAVLAAARAHGVEDRLIIGARSVADVRAFRAAMPAARILGLLPAEGDAAAFAAAGADAVRLWQRWIDAPGAGCAAGPAPSCLVARARAHGAAVWAIPDVPADAGAARALFARLIGLGLDGLLTDRAALAVEVRAAAPPR